MPLISSQLIVKIILIAKNLINDHLNTSRTEALQNSDMYGGDFSTASWQFWPASVAQLAETQCAPTGTVCRRSRGSIPGSTGRFRVRISGAHALRLISRAGKEGSTVSSIICDRWLILS